MHDMGIARYKEFMKVRRKRMFDIKNWSHVQTLFRIECVEFSKNNAIEVKCMTEKNKIYRRSLWSY